MRQSSVLDLIYLIYKRVSLYKFYIYYKFLNNIII